MSLELFEEILEFPDADLLLKFGELVGLDNEKSHLLKHANLMLNPMLLTQWSNKHYNKEIELLKYHKKKPPLYIFSGDVGTGKTSLAESFGAAIAQQQKLGVTLYRLSLKTRGDGMVGQMTKMISSAFSIILAEGKKHSIKDRKPKHAIILVIDEADAIAQSREASQMHHEDRAGVNALIRGIDTISNEHLPVIVVMCTNRLSAIDPAIKRRAAVVFDFIRPNEEQRAHLLKRALGDTEITDEQLQELVTATGSKEGRNYGFTYSDIQQRLLPNLLLDFFPEDKIDFKKVINNTNQMIPSPPFKEEKAL